jgi:hypothetical protein
MEPQAQDFKSWALVRNAYQLREEEQGGSEENNKKTTSLMESWALLPHTEDGSKRMDRTLQWWHGTVLLELVVQTISEFLHTCLVESENPTISTEISVYQVNDSLL